MNVAPQTSRDWGGGKKTVGGKEKKKNSWGSFILNLKISWKTWKTKVIHTRLEPVSAQIHSYSLHTNPTILLTTTHQHTFTALELPGASKKNHPAWQKPQSKDSLHPDLGHELQLTDRLGQRKKKPSQGEKKKKPWFGIFYSKFKNQLKNLKGKSHTHKVRTSQHTHSHRQTQVVADRNSHRHWQSHNLQMTCWLQHLLEMLHWRGWLNTSSSCWSSTPVDSRKRSSISNCRDRNLPWGPVRQQEEVNEWLPDS